MPSSSDVMRWEEAAGRYGAGDFAGTLLQDIIPQEGRWPSLPMLQISILR